MSAGDIADEISQLAIAGEGEHNGVGTAAERVLRETRRVLRPPIRKIRDVTEEFATAAEQLQPGQLVKDDFFTLFEAVSALEIMDPKMDSGFVPTEDTLEPDFDVCSDLPAEQVLWIMDQLFCHLAAWHDGYPLSQTIFTSLHVDRLISPDNHPPYLLHRSDLDNTTLSSGLVHHVLRAYCLALIKSCALVLHTVQSQNFYEEEDFVTHLFGRELLPGLSANDQTTQVEKAFEWLSAADIETKLRHALDARLRFIVTYLALLVDARHPWDDLLETIQGVAKSHDLCHPLPEAFSEKVQRQLATSTPPRPMLEVSWDDATTKWKNIANDVVEAGRLTIPAITQDPHCLQRATWVFAYRDPQPNTFVRAHMQTILFGGERIADNTTFFDLMLTDIRDLVLAGDPLVDLDSFQIEVPSDPRHRCARIMESFMDKALDEYVNIYRMVCQNRCRIRRTFTQAISIWDGLETEAMRTDAELQHFSSSLHLDNTYFDPLLSWTKLYKLQIMAWTFQLGFETDIYLPDELCMMYWMLAKVLHQRIRLLESVEHFLVERMRSLNRKRDTRRLAECLASQDYLRSLRLQAEATLSLAKALWPYTEALHRLHLISVPRRDYADERLLYEARMKPFLSVTNDPLPDLEEFHEDPLGAVPLNEVWGMIDVNVKQAKSTLGELKKVTPGQVKCVGTEEQWKREIKKLETTCVAIAVQTSQLKRLAEQYGKEQGQDLSDMDLAPFADVSIPKPEARYHLWWPVPQVKERKK
ncbi:hypothetical protein BAUCODRAFT_139082 [Baudoinia panamericana UAMH 10762]|uniref:Mak10 subunit, NatC N(Alpha)-terminal acetyltransferase n=1 Tax=Baudoinia panamericana (strain UAMH 10762) TaxID=717646 RepID=M2NAQ9_BAUPA|nr:uncharacterized protein BAUCODRAFT_139082 [Baudoinia panamericana UAMH 10762]EMC96229.1 hypothetical protein BAUCODRAFT_139082 [Baudoinia panamericana UAMH 10762]